MRFQGNVQEAMDGIRAQRPKNIAARPLDMHNPRQVRVSIS